MDEEPKGNYPQVSLELTDDKSTLVLVMAIRQSAITWADVDPELCHHMPSLGRNELSLDALKSLRPRDLDAYMHQ